MTGTGWSCITCGQEVSGPGENGHICEETIIQITIATLSDLKKFWAKLPEGSHAAGIPSDLDAGNFDHTSIELPDGEEINITYTGPVAEGYVSSFERE